MKNYITKDEYYKLKGLLHMAQEYEQKQKDIIESAQEILKVEDEFGSLFEEGVWEDYTLDYILKNEKVKVEDE